MASETEAASAEASSNLVTYGYYTPNIILHSTDLQEAEYNAQAVRKELQRIGFSARIETINTPKPISVPCPATASRTSVGR